MDEARAPNYELAELDYISGMKYKDIADKYNVTLNTVKSWKTRYKWSKNNKKCVHTKTEKVCTLKKYSEPIAKEVEQVIDNPDLTDKQRLFCLYYIKCFNATKAYQKAYGCDYEVAAAISYRLLGNDGVRNEIARLKENKLNQAFLEPADIFQRYIDIAFANINDYVTYGREEVPVMGPFGPIMIEDEDTKKKVALTKEVNVIKFNESSKVDGYLISEIKQGRDGASIKLKDSMKALEWLTEHMDMATEEQRLRVNKLRYEVSQLSGGNDGDTGIKDFLKAVKPTEEDIKAMFEDEEVKEDAEEDQEK